MIKCFIIAAVSADGFIAKDAKHSSIEWTSKADKKRFVELTKRAGIVVMGGATYRTIGRPLPNRKTIVYSRTGQFEGSEVTQKPPLELLTELEALGHKEVAICGGAQIYTLFMQAGVVDEIYLTLEPIMFGKGITLFNEDLKYHLKLVEAQTSEETGTLLLHYKVDYVGNIKRKD